MNKIQLKIPIHVLNMDTVEVDTVRFLTFGVRMGGEKLWHAVHEITIGDTLIPVPNASPKIVSVKLINNVTTTDTILAGNAAVYQVILSIRPGYHNFKVALKGTNVPSMY